MKKCFMFPGQGSQKIGMGQEFYSQSAAARQIWDEAEEITGSKLRDMVFEGPACELKKTEVTQPAVYLTEIVILHELQRAQIKAAAAAGHSLGEYAAAVAAGAVSWQRGLTLVKRRGEIFKQAAEKTPGGMLAAIGIKEKELSRLLSGFSGVAEIVNYNCPGQLVVSAEKKIFSEVFEAVKEKAKIAVKLEVSGAFHSSLMDEAGREMKEEIEAVEVSDPKIPFYVNFSGRKVKSAAEVRKALIRQVNSPVKWMDTVLNIKKDFPGVMFLEVGPGKVLRGLMRRIDRKMKVRSISAPGDIKREDL